MDALACIVFYDNLQKTGCLLKDDVLLLCLPWNLCNDTINKNNYDTPPPPTPTTMLLLLLLNTYYYYYYHHHGILFFLFTFFLCVVVQSIRADMCNPFQSFEFLACTTFMSLNKSYISLLQWIIHHACLYIGPYILLNIFCSNVLRIISTFLDLSKFHLCSI